MIGKMWLGMYLLSVAGLFSCLRLFGLCKMATSYEN